MRYNISGRNIEVTVALKEKIETKLNRIEKLFPPDANANVTLSVEKQTQTIEVTIPLKRRILRAEVESFDMYAAIDEVVDVLEKQMIKYKNRLRDKARGDNSFKDEFKSNFFADSSAQAENSNVLKIEKTKKFALKPMDSEEAVMEMELLGHNFFVFRNGDTDEVNVVYKRRNGTYGLIEPEF